MRCGTIIIEKDGQDIGPNEPSRFILIFKWGGCFTALVGVLPWECGR